MTIKNKVIIITGASSGIGEATALLLAEKGAKVVLAARRVEKLEKIV
ncbi:SDR family NAD(P)-dependent oxidoreductase, partial [Listeria monocytogenes]|nr:SDR family NAD(P)-dependent oxidoreductase [Listeria monocytogenes]